MRVMRRNKQTIKYSNLVGDVDEYQLDENGHLIVDYVEDGVTYYVMTGRKILMYSDPAVAKVNISFSGGETLTQDFGVDMSSYDASIVYDLNEYPISETSLVWYESTPTFIGEGVARRVDPNSADYKVTKVKPSLNYTKLLLAKRVK